MNSMRTEGVNYFNLTTKIRKFWMLVALYTYEELEGIRNDANFYQTLLFETQFINDINLLSGILNI